MSTIEFTIRYLLAIEKKNQDYFTANNLKILDCVLVLGNNLVSVHIVNETLPDEIKYEIESMFWIN